MTLENKLQELIELKSSSVRAFSIEADLPYTTLRSIIQRGVLKANIENIFKIASHLGMTAEQIADLDTVNTTVSDIINVSVQLDNPRQIKVRNYAQDELEEQSKVINLSDYVEETMYGHLSAGSGEFLTTDIQETVQIPKSIVPDQHYDLILQVNGDSMEPMFEDNEYVFVRKTKDIRSGQIGVLIINGESFLKKIYINDDHLRLVSLNKKYDDLIFDDVDDIKVIGTVVM